MGITARYACDGCDAVADGTASIRQQFASFSGRSHGFGVYRVPSVETVAPEKWVPFDLIGCTYCPKCADELWPERETSAAMREERGDE